MRSDTFDAMQAQVEGLALRVADNKTGYFGVYFDKPGRPKPFKAEVKRRGGKTVSLGCFATAEEAALCVARTPEGQRMRDRNCHVERAPLASGEALQQAHDEGITLRKSSNAAGYVGVALSCPSRPNPSRATVYRTGKKVQLGSFATAEEAALCVARSQEGQAAVAMAASESEVGVVEVTAWSDDDDGDDDDDHHHRHVHEVVVVEVELVSEHDILRE